MQSSADAPSERAVSHLAGHSLFNDVEDEQLRAYNRCVTLVNFKEDDSPALAREYFSMIRESDHVAMILMAGYIKAKGFDETLKEIRSDS